MNIPKNTLILILTSIVVGCASTTPVTKYLPEQRENVFPFFTAGQPIAAIQDDESFLLLSLEPTYLSGRHYIRLWLLYHNTSNNPYLLAPLKFAVLKTTRNTVLKTTRNTINKTKSCLPETPTTILAHISDEKSKKMIMQAIGGALQAVAVKPTTARTVVYDKSSIGPAFTATTTVNDESEKRAEVHDRTVSSMMNTSMWYELYQNSISEGILRRNTVFPGQSVNGYIYFPLPSLLLVNTDFWYTAMNYNDFVKSMDFTHVVSLNLPKGAQEIEFTPIEGE